MSDQKYEADSETLAQMIEVSISGTTLEYEISGGDETLKTNVAGENAAAIVERMDNDLAENKEYNIALDEVNPAVVEVKASSKTSYPQQEPVTTYNNNKTPPKAWREQKGSLTAHFFVNGTVSDLENSWEGLE